MGEKRRPLAMQRQGIGGSTGIGNEGELFLPLVLPQQKLDGLIDQAALRDAGHFR